MPPGSFGFPVLGNPPPAGVAITEHLRKLKKKYGNIYTTKWGSRVVVVLADHRLIKKALTHPDFQGRMEFYSWGVIYYFLNLGVLFSLNNVWKENRRFLLRNLRDLGMGRTRIEASIQDEAEMLVTYLEEHNLDKPTEIDWGINIAVLNVIWLLLGSKRYDANDEVIKNYYSMVDQSLQVLQGRIVVLDLMPWLERFLPQVFIEKVLKSEVIATNRDKIFAMFMDQIHEHEVTLDRDNPRDVIDHYLLEMELQKDDPNTIFKPDYLNLLGIMLDLFSAGSETTASTLMWFIAYMAMYPEVQEEAQRVLDEVVPTSRLPSLDDKDQLPYIEALILDTLRLSSLIPNAIPHRTTATVQFEGYTIPKGTLIVPCLELCHKDPELWEEADRIRPEHFLDENGRLVSRRDGFMPFSIGRRQCLGESLARMELFLFVSAILQRFTISPPDGETVKAVSDPDKHFINQPKTFKIVLKKRI